MFWRKTRAYAAGLNGLYVNLIGREGKGIVTAGTEYDALIEDLRAKLLAFRDPENGEPVITEVVRARDAFHGSQVAHAPDLIVGYNRGYRSSDDSALGTVTAELITPNLGKWTGDHCMDHRLVPGMLVTNRELAAVRSDLLDLPVTILSLYGVKAPPQMSGRVLWAGGNSIEEVVMFGKKGIQLDPALMEKVRAAAAKAGYASAGRIRGARTRTRALAHR